MNVLRPQNRLKNKLIILIFSNRHFNNNFLELYLSKIENQENEEKQNSNFR